MENMLEVRNLTVSFTDELGKGREESVDRAVRGISFSMNQGEILAIIGESGSGKSMTALSIAGLLPKTAVSSGEIFFDGCDLMSLTKKERRKIQGKEISMIFQEPMTSLNPVFTIGYQIEESLILHKGMDKKAARERAIELLELVGIPEAGKRVEEYPQDRKSVV